MLPATKIKYLRTALIIALLLSQAACGGKGKELTDGQEQPVADMTLPPQTIKGATSAEESNPDETISFEKWKKQQEIDE
ncbi:MAG: hypothetical protein HKN85_07610 [Gammaproteobacteria bacterium]|nr:hypothetical protein [Gammaproteobacteria bacterium]